MSLNKIEKYCILGVLVLVLIAILCNIGSIKNNMKTIDKSKVFRLDMGNPVDFVDMPNDIKKISKKFNAFKEIYNSDELLLVYGYEPLSIEEEDNRIFHKDMNEILKEKDLKIKVLPYKNWRKDIDKAQRDNGKNPDACTLFFANEKDLQLIIETTQDCFRNACIIDAKNNKYVSIPKRPMDIAATIEKYLGK